MQKMTIEAHGRYITLKQQGPISVDAYTQAQESLNAGGGTPVDATPYRPASEQDRRTAFIGGGRTSYPKGYRCHSGAYSDYQPGK